MSTVNTFYGCLIHFHQYFSYINVITVEDNEESSRCWKSILNQLYNYLILRTNNLSKRLYRSNIEATSVVNTALGLSIVLEEQILKFQINGILMTSVVLNINMTHNLI